MDLEPALEALSLVEDREAGRRLDLICLDVPQTGVGGEDHVHSKKRRIKRLTRKQRSTASSPLHPDASRRMGSLSLSEELSASRSPPVLESSDSPAAEALPDQTSSHFEKDVGTPSPAFSDVFWPTVSLDQPLASESSQPIEESVSNELESKPCDEDDIDFFKPIT